MSSNSPISGILFFTLLFSSMVSGLAQEATLRPGDQVNLRIYGIPKSDAIRIAGLCTVSKGGTVRLPFLDKELAAAGLRPSVLVRNIERAYQEAYPGHKVSVEPPALGTCGPPMLGRTVTVIGEVKSPGDVPYRPDLTLIGALFARGSFTESAEVETIRLIRDRKTTKHNWQEMVMSPARNVKLKPGDCIVVARRLRENH